MAWVRQTVSHHSTLFRVASIASSRIPPVPNLIRLVCSSPASLVSELRRPAQPLQRSSNADAEDSDADRRGLAPCLSSAVAELIGRYSELVPDVEMIGYLGGYRGLLKGESVAVTVPRLRNTDDLLMEASTSRPVARCHRITVLRPTGRNTNASGTRSGTAQSQVQYVGRRSANTAMKLQQRLSSVGA